MKYNCRTGLENFLLRLKDYNSKYEYIDGYVNDNSKVKLRCKDCGDIIERWASGVRSGKEFRCFNCERQLRNKTKAEKESFKQQKIERKELNKVLDSVQLSFFICKNCGKLYIPIKNNSSYCSKTCYHRHNWAKHRKERIIKAEQNGKADYTITLDKLIKRDKNICYLCGKECNLYDYTMVNNNKIAGNYYPSIEHVIPIANGGTHSWDNVKLAHRICNSLKGDRIF